MQYFSELANKSIPPKIERIPDISKLQVRPIRWNLNFALLYKQVSTILIFLPLKSKTKRTNTSLMASTTSPLMIGPKDLTLTRVCHIQSDTDLAVKADTSTGKFKDLPQMRMGQTFQQSSWSSFHRRP